MVRQPRYDVALSFAGEQRAYVERVAQALKDAGVKVFYDDYEKVELWGKDLYEHLDYVYGKASKYCVMFVSEAYAAKVWTSHERKSAQARAIEEHTEYLLPARFDDTEIPGLRKTVGYLDLGDLEPDVLATLIKEKLGPRPVTPGFPTKLDRLYKALDVKPVKAKDKVRRKEVRDVAYSLYDALSRMTIEERTAVAGMLAFGCVGDLPEEMHASLDYMSRMTKMPHAEIVSSLAAVRSLNVKVRLRDRPNSHAADHGELLPNDKDVALSFWASRAPMCKDATLIAHTAVLQASNHFCAEHGLKIVTALDFHRLSSDDSGPVTMRDLDDGSGDQTHEAGPTPLELAT